MGPRYVLTMLTEYFGSERAALKFMRHFASVTIAFPDARGLGELAVERQIAASIAQNPSGPNVSRLADLHDLSNKRIRAMVRRSHGSGIREQRRLAREMHCRHPNLSRFRLRVRV